MKRLENKVSIITGAAQGIGLATALKFAQEGAIVIVCDIKQAAVDEVVKQCQALGATAAGFEMDVTRREMVDAVVASVKEKFGRIDVLVNNAGITQDARLQKMTLEQFDRVIDVNLRGVFHCSAGGGRHHGGPGLGRDPECLVGGGHLRQLRPDQLCGHQVRRDRLHQDLEPRTGPQGHPRERGGAGLYRHADPCHHAREGAEGAWKPRCR
jgi:NAD(P)-dependent dehydrogenase (short-subunit alcohol dehydrogenase family)